MELLRLASWRAARSGLEGQLLHPLTMRPAPADVVVRALSDHVREALEDSGDALPAREALAALLSSGTGARAQRELRLRTRSLGAMVTACARRTIE